MLSLCCNMQGWTYGERWLIEDRRIVVEWYGSPSWYEQVRLKAAKTPAQ